LKENDMAEGKTALIVGASRGLGLGLAQEHAGRGWRVIATERNRSDELHQAADASGGAIRLETVDVADDASNRALAERLAGETLDLLFLNAGVTGAMDITRAVKDEVDAIMHANAFGPYKLAKLLLEQVRPRTGVVAFMSSGMGSVGENTSGGWDVYRASKASQNVLARSLQVTEAGPRGVTVLSINPGWVKTDMGGPGASIDVPTSVRGIADQIDARAGTAEHVFLGWNGRILPW
jgi:NAD(P)-dependent dehydrogenase (short-subunit alcohol dehydrogenase family)